MNENYTDRIFMPGETVWWGKQKCTVLHIHKENKYTVVPQSGGNRNRQIIVGMNLLKEYTEWERLNDELDELDEAIAGLTIKRETVDQKLKTMTPPAQKGD